MNIQLSTRVDLLDTLHCTVSVDIVDDEYRVRVNHDVPNDHRDTVSTIKEEYVQDVEYLANVFAFEMVCVFKAIVELLGKAHKLKAAL